MPLYEEEWDGDIPLDVDEEERKRQGDAGEVIFRGEQLPWTPGSYELRYHHDGKHNVLSRVAPIEIYGGSRSLLPVLLSNMVPLHLYSKLTCNASDQAGRSRFISLNSLDIA